MFIVPRIDRAQRRNLVRIGSKARDFATLVRFYAVALLGGGKSSPTVADLLREGAVPLPPTSASVAAAPALPAGGAALVLPEGAHVETHERR